MKTILFAFCTLLTLPALAENLAGPLKIQTAQVVGETGTPTSCRMYRKRMEQFLQRSNEAAVAASVREDRVTLDDARRVLDLLQRADVPLELLKENILWTLDFDTSRSVDLFSRGPLAVEINSTYLKWQTTEGLFPEIMRVDMSPDLQTARVTYKMTYMEACLAPVSVAVKITADADNSVTIQALLNRNLL